MTNWSNIASGLKRREANAGGSFRVFPSLGNIIHRWCTACACVRAYVCVYVRAYEVIPARRITLRVRTCPTSCISVYIQGATSTWCTAAVGGSPILNEFRCVYYRENEAGESNSWFIAVRRRYSRSFARSLARTAVAPVLFNRNQWPGSLFSLALYRVRIADSPIARACGIRSTRENALYAVRSKFHSRAARPL